MSELRILVRPSHLELQLPFLTHRLLKRVSSLVSEPCHFVEATAGAIAEQEPGGLSNRRTSIRTSY